MTSIRPRRPEDMDACVRVLAEVHAASGYPLLWPANPVAWLSPDNLLAAWVAADERAVIGHVALYHAIGDAAAPLWSAGSGLPAERLAAVAKLFVAPGARGRGIGTALLAAATAEASARGLRAVLEVLDHDRGAIALYKRAGWRHVASAPAPWAQTDGAPASLHYYVAPDP